MPEDQYSQIIERLARIETNVKHLTDADDNGVETARTLEKRLNRLERVMYVAVGLACASGVGSLSDVLTTVLG